jgi:hypothetical protein
MPAPSRLRKSTYPHPEASVATVGPPRSAVPHRADRGGPPTDKFEGHATSGPSAGRGLPMPEVPERAGAPGPRASLVPPRAVSAALGRHTLYAIVDSGNPAIDRALLESAFWRIEKRQSALVFVEGYSEGTVQPTSISALSRLAIGLAEQLAITTHNPRLYVSDFEVIDAYLETAEGMQLDAVEVYAEVACRIQSEVIKKPISLAALAKFLNMQPDQLEEGVVNLHALLAGPNRAAEQRRMDHIWSRLNKYVPICNVQMIEALANASPDRIEIIVVATPSFHSAIVDTFFDFDAVPNISYDSLLSLPARRLDRLLELARSR